MELSECGWVPDLVISSDSARTQETWACMTNELPSPLPQVRFTRELYHAGLEAVQSVVRGVDDDVQTLLVLGHNPGWEAVVERLSDQSYLVMKTGHAALLRAPPGGWAAILAAEGEWALERIINPRRLIEEET